MVWDWVQARLKRLQFCRCAHMFWREHIENIPFFFPFHLMIKKDETTICQLHFQCVVLWIYACVFALIEKWDFCVSTPVYCVTTYSVLNPSPRTPANLLSQSLSVSSWGCCWLLPALRQRPCVAQEKVQRGRLPLMQHDTMRRLPSWNVALELSNVLGWFLNIFLNNISSVSFQQM